MSRFLYRGTTPTIMYRFKKVDPANFTEGFLTIRQGPDKRHVALEKTISESIIDGMTISWNLSQQESLKLREGPATIYFNYLLISGMRGVGKSLDIDVVTSGKDEVI